MSKTFCTRFSASTCSRRELFVQALSSLTRYGVHIVRKCWKLEYFAGEGFLDTMQSLEFATFDEAFALTQNWQGVSFPFESKFGLLALLLWDDPADDCRTAGIQETSSLETIQEHDPSERERWRVLLHETACALDADFYLRQCDPDLETIRKETFLRLLASDTFRSGERPPLLTVFHVRLFPHYEKDVVLPPRHRFHRRGDYVEIFRD